jgi:hypothetical protein
MAGSASGGNKLSPNRNVTAVAGNGGDKWGANGGGITPIGGGVTGQAGWDTPEDNALTTGQTQTNYLVSGTAPRTATRSILSDASRGVLPLGSADSSLPANGSNAG